MRRYRHLGCPWSKRLRYRFASFATDAEGRKSWGIGGRMGYWPCVHGPFFQVGIGTKRVSVWYGTEYVDGSG